MFTSLIEQMRYKTLIEETLYEIENVIKEERSIPYEITNIVNDISYQLSNEVKNSPSLPYNRDFITFKKGQFNVNLFNRQIRILWEYYSFLNDEIKNKAFIKDRSGQLRKTINGYEINVTIRAVNGKIDFARTLEALQHEFEHLWERLHRSNSPYKGMKLYNVANQMMNDPYNEYNQSIGRILYISKKWEQRAFANGVYQYLMNHTAPNLTRENLKETQLYCALICLKKDVEKLKSVNDYEQHPFLRATLAKLKSNFGIQYEQLIVIGEKAIRNITRILGRTLSKVEDDLFNSKKSEVLFPNYDFVNQSKNLY